MLVQERDTAAPRPAMHSERPSISVAWRLLATARASYYRLLEMIGLVAPTALRVSLALVFLWFGALKVTGDSPVLGLVSATVPWLEPALAMHLLGAVEVLLGVGLLLGRFQRLLLLVLAAHLSGTFLTFFMAPQLMFQHGGPMLLTADGEFVVGPTRLGNPQVREAEAVACALWATPTTTSAACGQSMSGLRREPATTTGPELGHEDGAGAPPG